MRGLRPLALTLACALLASPALAAKSPDKTDKKQVTAHAQAMIAFQRDLVSVVAPRADAAPLLGAALLARPLPSQPKYNDFHTLIDRAAVADGAGPAVSWEAVVTCNWPVIGMLYWSPLLGTIEVAFSTQTTAARPTPVRADCPALRSACWCRVDRLASPRSAWARCGRGV